MRALNKSWIGIALVILFGASLFFFKGSSRYSNLFNSDNFVANVSGTPISTSQFSRSLEMNIGQFAQMIGSDLTGEQIRAFQIHQLVLQNLINNAIFENEFDNLNFILDETIVAKKTKERFPNLYINNKINDDALNSFLRQQRLKIDDLVNIISYETRASVFDDLLFDINYPSNFSKKISSYNNQTRDIKLIKLPIEKIVVTDLEENKILRSDEGLNNYFRENNLNYMSDEKRDISYLLLDKESYKNQFTPNSQEISNYFFNNKNMFIIPEQRSFYQFNFKSMDEAKNFKLQVNGLDSEEIIKLANDKKIIFNEFKNLNKFQVLDELANEIFSLNKKQVSNVIETTLAHHVIILNNIIPEKQQSLDDVNEKIQETLTNVQLDNFFNDLKLKINQQIIDGLSINEIANENNLIIETLENISQNNNENNNLINNIISYSFSQKKDFISDVFDFNKNTSFVFNVNNIYPSKVQNIDDVFETVLQDYIKSKKTNFAENLFEKNKEEKNLLNINSIFKTDIDELKVQSTSSDLPTSFINNILNADIEKIVFTSDKEYIYFAIVDSIEIPDNISTIQDIKLTSEIKNAFGNEIFKTKNISINDELISGLLSQYK